ncbi:MAG TPA: AAA family ATPase [Nakamurella sp.]
MLPALVGRDRELGVLLGCLDEAQQGRASLVVCVGGPGIGKTRLVEEFAGLARKRGVLTAWGRAAMADGAPPYWPWHEVIRVLDAEGVAGPGPAALLAMSGVAPSMEERVRRFDEVARLVFGAARRRPLLVVLDDLDGADEPSQLLAQYLARTARDDRLLVVVCCRDTAGPIATLAQEPRTTQVELRGLERAAVGEQVSGIVGRAASDAELSAVYDATAGNPFFVSELARQLAEGPTIAGAIPRSVLDAIGQRLGRLSADCATSLRAAAVLGTRFAVPIVAAMTGSTVGDCLTSLDQAARAALVLDEDGSPEVKRFAHDLVRDAIVAGLGTGHRVTLHRRAAEAISAQAPHADGMVFDLAHHWSEAAVAGDRAFAVTWTERAGREAMRLHAYEDGRRWYGRALELNAGVLDDVARCRLMIAYAGAQCLSADFTGALETCDQAVAVAVRIGRPDLAGQAALVPEPTFDEGIDRVIRALCERALAVLDGAPAELRARVLAHYAWVCDHLSDLDAANPAASEALVLAEASGDPTALEAALTAHHMVRSGPDGLAEREANADRMWALGTRTGRTTACLSASEWRFDAASERGDLARAARELEAIGRWATRVGGPVAQWRLLRCRAMLAQASGCYADAYRLGAQAFGTLAATGFPPAFLLWSGLRSIQCHHTGQTSESLGTFGITDADAAGLDWPLAGVVPTLAPASMLADAGRLREAGAVYRRLGPASEWRESPHAMLFTWAAGIATAVAVGADDDVATLRAKLGAWRGHHVVNGRYAMAYGGPAELHLGRAAAHLGLVDDAIADLEQAVKSCTENGAEGYRAEAEYELAAAIFRRSAPGDLARARAITVAALRRTEVLCMAPIRAQAWDLLNRIDADPAVALTRRELEVADLVAQGLTNREIASRLFVSERTAQNHVQHILDKLDLPNRSQIAVWVRGRSPERSGN